MGLSLSHLLLVLVVVLIVFGAGKLPQVMGDFAKGIRAFRDGMKDAPPPSVQGKPSRTTQASRPRSRQKVSKG